MPLSFRSRAAGAMLWVYNDGLFTKMFGGEAKKAEEVQVRASRWRRCPGAIASGVRHPPGVWNCAP